MSRNKYENFVKLNQVIKIMISKIITYLRKSKNYKQKELAEKCNIAISTISGYETNYSQPTFEMIEKIANVCGYEIIFRNKETKEEISSNNIERKEI